MEMRFCLVTGANRGLGLEFTRQLLARGDRVVATCRHPGKAAALNALAGEYPGRLHVLPLDVSDPKSIAGLVRELPLLDAGEGEGARLELLVNCAGVLHSGERFGSVAAATLEDSFRTNAMGPLSSVLGSIASVARFGTPSYNLSKAAQNMATALLAQALQPRGIVVLALHPGWARTDMGGDNATVPVPDAVAGLLRVIDRATARDSGSFHDWRGETLPW
jgi:NAD(P)-dependent dehydrogenase (short-subunit alcohol dehydrogenase family)